MRKLLAFLFLLMAVVLACRAEPKVNHVFKSRSSTQEKTVGQPIRKPLFTLPPLPDRPNPPTPEDRNRAAVRRAALDELREAQAAFLQVKGFFMNKDMTAAEISALAKQIAQRVKILGGAE